MSLFKVGDKLFIRTVTYHLVGEITEVADGFLRLKDAAWVADTERFALDKRQALVACVGMLTGRMS